MLRIARRGAWGYEPENTLAAFVRATEIPCDVVEFDVHKTLDGHVVVMHDHTVRRTCDGIGNIHELRLDDLRRFHEKNGEIIPTLEGVIEILKPKRRMMIDIKDKGMEDEVLRAIRNQRASSKVIIDSDHTDVIENMRQLDDKVALFLGGIKPGNLPDVVRNAKQIRADMIKIKNTAVTPSVVHAVHEQGLGLYVWGAERPHEIREMVKLGVDAIVCMFPDRIPAGS